MSSEPSKEPDGTREDCPRHQRPDVRDLADDDKFIACALSSGADYIVSGDKDILAAAGYEGVQVVKPKEFLNLME